MLVELGEPGRLSFDGGTTFVDAGLPAGVQLYSVVVLDDEWFALTMWHSPPEDSTGFPDSFLHIPLISHRDTSGRWTHQAVSTTFGSDEVFVMDVISTDDAVAYLAWVGPSHGVYVVERA